MGEQFAQALVTQDSERLRGVLADGIDFRALTPGWLFTGSSSVEVVDEIILGTWFGGDADVYELREVSTGEVSGRQRVSYRLGVTRGGQDWVIEQQAYYDTDTDGDRITWIRILCAGYQPDHAHGKELT